MSRFLLAIFIIIAIFAVFNIPVTERSGMDYKWHNIKLPLYLKTLDFFDRHYNYKYLVKTIIKDKKKDEDKALVIFDWTYKNIRRVPEGFPVIDDHVWYTIVRGYGEADQISYVFVTLCNYAGLDAFYTKIYSQDGKDKTNLSFVKLNKKWAAFDPYHGVYFQNKAKDFASIEDIQNNDWLIKRVTSTKLNFDYKKYLSNLIDIKTIGLNRAKIQSPLNRIIFEVKKRLRLQ